MKMNKFFLSAAAALGLLFNSYGAHASPFVNGSFEVGPAVGPQGFTTLNGGDTSITGWTVGGPNTANAIDYIGGYWVSEDGTHSLDLNGLVPGSISQTFDVVAGHTYQVSFWMAGNPAGGPTIKTLDATADVTLSSASFDTTGTSLTNMGWTLKTFDFTATSTSETLSFTSTTIGDSGVSGLPTAFGPALDNVSVTAIPEASTWAMMLLGLLGMGFIAYRRRSSEPLLRIA
jgi:choice-of-anchor C domain-containing protein